MCFRGEKHCYRDDKLRVNAAEVSNRKVKESCRYVKVCGGDGKDGTMGTNGIGVGWGSGSQRLAVFIGISKSTEGRVGRTG